MTKNTSTGLKINEETYCGLMKVKLLLWGPWTADSLSDDPQVMLPYTEEAREMDVLTRQKP